MHCGCGENTVHRTTARMEQWCVEAVVSDCLLDDTCRLPALHTRSRCTTTATHSRLVVESARRVAGGREYATKNTDIRPVSGATLKAGRIMDCSGAIRYAMAGAFNTDSPSWPFCVLRYPGAWPCRLAAYSLQVEHPSPRCMAPAGYFTCSSLVLAIPLYTKSMSSKHPSFGGELKTPRTEMLSVLVGPHEWSSVGLNLTRRMIEKGVASEE